MDLLNRYYLYLLALGYTVRSVADKSNTITNYVDGVSTISEWEGITVEELAKNIKTIYPKYGKGGVKDTTLINDNNRTYNGIKHFKKFIELCNSGTL